MFKEETLLITGGTGSFGNAVLNRFLNNDYFKEITEAHSIIFDSSATPTASSAKCSLSILAAA